jgi:hypothetical protein
VLPIALCSAGAACGARTGLDSAPGDASARGDAPLRGDEDGPRVEPTGDADVPPPNCGSTGRCTSTQSIHSGALGGLAGADAICEAEFPGSHFYRQSCDGERGFLGTTSFGYAELELGPCWNCDGWTSSDSGPYSPSTISCSTGYATVGAVLPHGCRTGIDPCWRICEAGDEALICCWP